MSLPTPKPGLVIRYSYLWARERDKGREEGVKDRPCAVLLATTTEQGDLRVIVLPITHVPPNENPKAPSKFRRPPNDVSVLTTISPGSL